MILLQPIVSTCSRKKRKLKVLGVPSDDTAAAHLRAVRFGMFGVQGTSKKKTAAKTRMNAEETQRKIDRLVAEKIANAERLAPSSDGRSKSSRIRDIRKNKSEAVDEERRAPFHQPQKSPKGKSAKVLNLGESSGEDYAFPSLIDDLYDEE